jgi:hypothetical protein
MPPRWYRLLPARDGDHRMNKPLLIAVLCLAALAVPGTARADVGVWVAEEQFSQVNVACVRKYVCRPATDLMFGSDYRLEITPPSAEWGVCVIGTGDIDSCNVCVTNEPKVPCLYEVVKR